MHDIQETDDTIHTRGGGDVSDGGAEARERAGPAVANAGAPSPEGGGGAEWKMVTRAVTRGRGRPPKARTDPKEGCEFTFEQHSETAKKRRANEALDVASKKPDMAEQVAQLKELVLQLLEAQKATTATLIQQGKEIQELRTSL